MENQLVHLRHIKLSYYNTGANATKTCGKCFVYSDKILLWHIRVRWGFQNLSLEMFQSRMLFQTAKRD